MDQNTRTKVLLAGLVALFFGICPLVSFIGHVPSQNRGVTIEGYVTARSFHQTCTECSGESLLVAYSWEIDGHRFSGENTDDIALYYNYTEGAPITLVYMPNNPSTATPKETLMREDDKYNLLVWVGVTVIGGSLGYILFSVLQTRLFA